MKKFINKKRYILLISLLAIFMLVGCSNDSTAEETMSVNEVESTSTPEATVEPTSTPEVSEEPTSTPEATEEPAPSEEPTEAPTTKPEEPESTEAPTETPAPTEEPTPEPTEPPHTHNYSTSVTQPTCTSQGYTTYTCNCGDSYRDNYTNGSHNYSNGTCTNCGASDPNYIPPHVHSWTEHTWTEDVVDKVEVEVFICNGCGAEFAHVADVKAHQETTGWDGTPAHTGWANTYKWIETITQIIHHYRECACGAREDIS